LQVNAAAGEASGENRGEKLWGDQTRVIGLSSGETKDSFGYTRAGRTHIRPNGRFFPVVVETKGKKNEARGVEEGKAKQRENRIATRVRKNAGKNGT